VVEAAVEDVVVGIDLERAPSTRAPRVFHLAVVTSAKPVEMRSRSTGPAPKRRSRPLVDEREAYRDVARVPPGDLERHPDVGPPAGQFFQKGPPTGDGVPSMVPPRRLS
jgi:hypothetical protein